MRQLKDKLRSNSLIFRINQKYKAFITRKGIKNIHKKYNELIKINQFEYSKRKIISSFEKKFKLNSNTRKINILWIGTNLSQDSSGFLQALNKKGTVHIFYNSNGEYGMSSNLNSTLYNEKVARLNAKTLIKQFDLLIKDHKVDIVLGQMTAQKMHKSALEHIQNHNIPVVNIAMDDRLPIHWRKVNGTGLTTKCHQAPFCITGRLRQSSGNLSHQV